MHHRSLENHPWFPYIAWSTVVGFALFVGSLTVEVNREITALTEASAATEYALYNW